MSFRDSLSLPGVLRDVVAPCLSDLLRPGEVQAVDLAWRTIRRPDHPDNLPLSPGLTIMPGPPRWVEETRLVLTLTFTEEIFSFDIAAETYFPSADGGELEDVRDRLFSDLQDFIAESRFGWGELRP